MSWRAKKNGSRDRFDPWYLYMLTGALSLPLASDIHCPTSETAHTTRVAFDGTPPWGMGGTGRSTVTWGVTRGGLGCGLARMRARISTVLPRPISCGAKGRCLLSVFSDLLCWLIPQEREYRICRQLPLQMLNPGTVVDHDGASCKKGTRRK
jgi:hypothetical protein